MKRLPRRVISLDRAPKIARWHRAVSLAALWGLAALSLAGCATLNPTLNPIAQERPWSPDQAVLAEADFHGSEVTVKNIRQCTYQTATEYTVDHYDRAISLESVRNVDFIVVPFAEMPSLAHTMLSFGLDDGTYIAVSVEVRKHVGDEYQPVLATLPVFEIMYVVGDERDLIKLRANYRLDGVYLYRTRATPRQAQELFVSVMKRVDKLAQEPEYYNTLTNNCTTNIRRHINELAPNRVGYDYRVLLPGYSDRLAYDLGLLDTDLSFEETRNRARVNYLAYLHRDSANFSQKIRQGLVDDPRERREHFIANRRIASALE